MAAEGTESVPDRYTVEVVMVGLFLFELLAAVHACVCLRGCNKSSLSQMFLHSPVLGNHQDLQVSLISIDMFISS